MQWLNYHHLYYFWVIAKEGGVTSACKRLRLTQPTLSGQLKQFESSLGSPLFERRARRMALNETGQIVFDYADSIFRTGRELIEALNHRQTRGVVNLNVGILPTLPKKNIYDILQPAFSQAHIRVAVTLGDLETLLAKLEDRALDMAISHRRPPAGMTGIKAAPLERVPVIFVAHPDFRSMKKRFPQTLEGRPVYLPTHQSHLREELVRYFKRHGVAPVIKGEVQDSELLRVIAVSGDAVVPIERSAVSDLIKARSLVVLDGETGIWEDFFLLMPDGGQSHPAVERILRACQER